MLDWNVAVYCANEVDRLQDCLGSVAAALHGQRALITVVLNGSNDGSLQLVRDIAAAGLPVEGFQIKVPDKSNAINQFVHALRSPARAYAGVDGYVAVGPRSFSAMGERLRSDTGILAVTGIALSGRTMQHRTASVPAGGVLHGQFHALRPSFLDGMAARGLRLPVGLYRGDGLLGSMAAHALDSVNQPWDDARISYAAEATFTFRSLSPFRPQDVQRQLRRKVQQMRGVIENKAIHAIIRQRGYEGLPADANDMIRDYLATYGLPLMPLADRLFQRLALRQHARAVRHLPADLAARRVV